MLIFEIGVHPSKRGVDREIQQKSLNSALVHETGVIPTKTNLAAGAPPL